MICNYCQKKFLNRSNLLRHQRTSKQCLFAQGKISCTERARQKVCDTAPCPGCGKDFTKPSWLKSHMSSCHALKLLESRKREEFEMRREHELKVSSLQQTIETLMHEKAQEYMRGRLDATKEINDNLVGLDIAQARVRALEKKYLRKQRRVRYPDKYIVYLITNSDLQSRRTYIVGSATCLKDRLGTYNKSAEHTVVYYSKCKDKDKMKLLESMVLTKLCSNRECANRDRFVLPEGEGIDFFIEAYKQGERFLSLTGEKPIQKI